MELAVLEDDSMLSNSSEHLPEPQVNPSLNENNDLQEDTEFLSVKVSSRLRLIQTI